MGAVKRLTAMLLLVAAAPGHAEDVARWHVYIDEASSRFGVPTRWIERVIRAESNGRTRLNGAPIRSRAGAIGLMQLMPATWADMRMRLGLGFDADDPHDNILAGTLYLRLMYDRFGYPGLFGAYNAGPAAYAAWLAGKRRLPAETIAYLATVGDARRLGGAAISPPVSPPMFIIRNGGDGVPSGSDRPAGEGALFAVRRPGP